MPKRKPMKQRSATANDTAIGLRIRQRRMEQKVSQAELGAALGVSFQQIQKYEKGVNRVSGVRLVQLAKVLDCDIRFFLPDATSDRPKAPSVLDDFMTTKDGLMIAEAFVRIGNKAVRHTIATFIDGISRSRSGRLMQAAE